MALRIYSEHGESDDIALAERNLGVTLLDRVGDHRSDEIEEAVRRLESSLSKLSSDRDPHAFAVTLNNIGRAYALRIEGTQDENFAAARDAFERAAVHFLKLGEVSNARIAYASAGGISYEMKEWLKAVEQFLQAIDLLECEWQEILTAQGRLQLNRDTVAIFDFAVLAAIKGADTAQGICLLERGRQKLLVETYYTKGIHPTSVIGSDVWKRLENLKRTRADLEHEVTCYRLDNSFRNTSPRVETVRKEIESLHLQEKVLAHEIIAANPDFLPVATPPKPERIGELAARLNAYLCAVKPTIKGTLVFAFNPRGTIRHTLLEDATLKYWEDLLFKPGGWVSSYAAFRNGSTLNRIRWLRSMDKTLRELYRTLIRPCLSLMSLPPLEDSSGQKSSLQRIYFLAGGPLELLPLHAAFWEDGPKRRYLADVADTGYFSSFRLLEQATERLKRLGPSKKLNVYRAPNHELSFMRWEAAFASSLFGARADGRTLVATKG